MTAPSPARRVLVTGGAGFVGSSLTVGLAERHPDWEIVALDNLRRRGSELNLGRVRSAGAAFLHGDIREPADLASVGPIDALIECSAEPSVLAAATETAYSVQSNLVGAYNCLELANRERAQLVFLSTSRVYPVAALGRLRYEEGATRFELTDEQPQPGASGAGVAEDFPMEGVRTLYGATKLCAELLTGEYVASFGLSAVVNRCGVIAGPWQMARSDQGVFAHWMLCHHLGRPLAYIGYGGKGKQVRDLLHVDDLVELVDEQLDQPERWSGVTVNVGGGPGFSLSLLETTELCRELTGREVPIASEPEPRHGDIPIYISDCSRLERLAEWRPRREPRVVLEDILQWIRENEDDLVAALPNA